MGSVIGNPNQVNYPYGGGTDNPGDSTAVGSSYNATAASETGLLTARDLGVRHPGVPPTIAQVFEDTVLPAGVTAVPPTAAGFESLVDRGADPEGGIDPVTGAPREAGQDEVAGATETTSGTAPSAFPEPTP